MGYLRSFLPWLVFVVISTRLDWRAAAVVGLVFGIVSLVLARRRGVAWDALVIEASSTAYFLVLIALAVVAPHSPLHAYATSLSLGWLAATAWGSLAVRRPFTLGIAKRQVEPELWGRPLFHRTNAVVTAVWAAAFTLVAAGVGVVNAVAPHATLAIVAIKAVGFAAAVVFTLRYPKIVRARAEAQLAAAARVASAPAATPS